MDVRGSGADRACGGGDQARGRGLGWGGRRSGALLRMRGRAGPRMRGLVICMHCGNAGFHYVSKL